MRKKTKKVAIVYDWIDKWGGVERVLLFLHRLFPQAIFFTSYYDEKKAQWAKGISIKTSFIQRLPDFIKKNRILSLPFYPFAFESFNFGEFDLVISVTSSFAKGIITLPKTFHLCYLLTPPRFLWTHQKEYRLEGWKKIFIWPYLAYLKKWDLAAAWRPDKIVAISKTVASRCFFYYQREAKVIYPPFDIEYWKKKEEEQKQKNNFYHPIFKERFYLLVSRFEPYKKIELAIEVFNRLGRILVVVGEGSLEKKLKKMAKKNIVFLKKLSDGELSMVYKKAYALIMPQEEDFGYTALEGLFFQLPVIAYGRGGVTEIVENGKTGVFFERQKEKELREAIERMDKIRYNLIINLKKLKDNKNFWNKFSQERFIKEFEKECNFINL